jgi:dTDP-4-dehydrorhamnose 3,5-epimerase
MDIRQFEVPDVKLILPKRFTDARGYFSETWSDRTFRLEISDVALVQDNQSVSSKKGTLRGLHFQKPPFSQGKLVRVVRGSILDVAVDIRTGSPTYMQHVATELNTLDGAQLWIPPGFLHGFCTLEDMTEVCYKVTSYYSANHDAGVAWNDPSLAIKWPVDSASVVLSEKDQRLPRLCDLPDLFTYEG